MSPTRGISEPLSPEAERDFAPSAASKPHRSPCTIAADLYQRRREKEFRSHEHTSDVGSISLLDDAICKLHLTKNPSAPIIADSGTFGRKCSNSGAYTWPALKLSGMLRVRQPLGVEVSSGLQSVDDKIEQSMGIGGLRLQLEVRPGALIYLAAARPLLGTRRA